MKNLYTKYRKTALALLTLIVGATATVAFGLIQNYTGVSEDTICQGLGEIIEHSAPAQGEEVTPAYEAALTSYEAACKTTALFSLWPTANAAEALTEEQMDKVTAGHYGSYQEPDFGGGGFYDYSGDGGGSGWGATIGFAVSAAAVLLYYYGGSYMNGPDQDQWRY